MSTGRHSIWRGLAVVFVTVAVTLVMVVAALLAGPEIQALLVRAVVVSLIIFVALLFLRYFGLLWFAYLGHSERNILGVRELHQLPGVSILVPAYNEGEVLERALDEPPRRSTTPEYEVLVIDDGSKDDTLEAGERSGRDSGVPGSSGSITKPNGGKASALNAGIAHSKSPADLLHGRGLILWSRGRCCAPLGTSPTPPWARSPAT